MSRQVVVLAGGLATRMLPLTERVPKLLLPVAGRPFAAWLLERLAACGVDEVVLCLGHLADAVVAALPTLTPPGLRVRVSDEGGRRLGTAGALRLALPLLEPSFVVTYGDSYLPFDYLEPLRRLDALEGALGVLAVYRNEGRIEPSNTAVHGAWVARYEKRPEARAGDPPLDCIDYGAMSLRRAVVEALEAGAVWGLDAVQRDLASAGRLGALEVAERFFEVGSPEGLLELEGRLASRRRATEDGGVA